MCGISGIVGPRGSVNNVTREVVDDMNAELALRGPDDEGVYANESLVLGHRRLAIIDLEHGKQPMLSNDGNFALVFNGEIYNYVELRQVLVQAGIRVGSFSDTEILLSMLIWKGEEALHLLNGMFSFFFIDLRTNEWILARDPFGIKPLYYHELPNNQLIFSSEIKALLKHPALKASVNNRGLGQYFSFQYCIGNNTLFEGVYKVEPGQYLKGKDGTISTVCQYWNTSYAVDEHHTEQYFLDKLKYLLEDSLKLQVRSDVPLGAYLSGGLDSSVVATLASECIGSGLPVFSGKFLESKAFDESEYARILADNIKADMHEIIPTADDFVAFLPEIVRSMDEPLAGPGVFPQYMVSQYASKHVKVILGGQGGDEIFGGYARYLVGYLEQALKGAIFETQEEGKHLVGLESIVPNLPLLAQYVPMLRNFWKDGIFDNMDSRYFRLINRAPDLEDVLCPDAFEMASGLGVYEDFLELFNRPDTTSYINKMTDFDFKTLLPALLHVEDRVSMSHSLESRVPLLDPRIVSLVASAPPSMKFNGGKTKALLKRAVNNKLPDKIINRKDKMGFPVPLSQWLEKGVVRDFVMDTLTSRRSLERGIYKKQALQMMTQRQGVGSRQLWGALNLELWHQIYIDA